MTSRFLERKRRQERGKPLFEHAAALHWSPDYGPHICAGCWGAGWARVVLADGSVESSQLVRCTRCNPTNNRQLAHYWQFSNLNPARQDAPSLENFVARDPATNEMRQAALRFVASATGWLTIWGVWGSGKTHVAEAITRTLLSRGIGCVYLRAPDLFAYLGAVERYDGDETNYESRRRWLSELPVLVVDEVNKEKNSEAVIKLRTMLFDARYRAALEGIGGSTVLISNDPPAAWHDPALASRAQDTRFVCIESTRTDFRRVKR